MCPEQVSSVFSSAARVYYRVSELLWQGWRQNLIGAIKQHHCHIDSVLSTSWRVRVSAVSPIQRQSWGLRSSSAPSFCDRLEMFRKKYTFFSLIFIYPVKVKRRRTLFPSVAWQRCLWCSRNVQHNFKAECIVCYGDSTHISSPFITCVWKKKVFFFFKVYLCLSLD